jgi:hypothetical protein
VTATQFSYAQAAFSLAGAIAIGLTLWWFYQTTLTPAVGVMVFFTVGCVGLTWMGGLKWLDLKENIYAYVVVGLDELRGNGPYPLKITSSGPYPTYNVRLTIRNSQEPLNTARGYQVGDVDSGLMRNANLPPLPGPGIYDIRIFARSGNFQEILTIYPNGEPETKQEITISRMTIDKGGVVVTPMQTPF